MPQSSWVVIGVAIGWTLVSFGVAALLIRGLVTSTWLKMQKAHPGMEHASDAVRKNFQSFKLDLMNLGYCVHVAVDESHLHLLPAALLRWFGAKPISVPWDHVEDSGKTMFRSRKVKIEGVTVWGPNWALKLAASDVSPSEPPRT